MISLLFILMILMPLITIGLLFTASTDRLRRGYLAGLGLCLFVITLMYLLIVWAAHTDPTSGNTYEWLFTGVGSSVARPFFSNVWLPIVYALLLVGAGHFANQHAQRRLLTTRAER